MPNIKPVSDLRNYNEVLKSVAINKPVFLTKNGRGKFAIIDIEEYEELMATVQLLTELNKGEKSGKDNGWLSIDAVEKGLGFNNV